ncbi:MAG: MarP family serine protease [Gordonia sp. (in: high G+C Gram-positive bacteria)]
MSASTGVDVIVIVLALLAALSGWRQGAVASALAVVGVLLGAVAGILLAPHILSRIDERGVRLLVGVGLLVGLVVVGEVSGMVLGRAARNGIRSLGLRHVDSAIGLMLQVVAVLIAAWLLAIPLQRASSSEISSAVRGSRVLAGIDSVAPTWLRDLPRRRLAPLLDDSGLPEIIGPYVKTPIARVDPPDPALTRSPVVSRIRPSVVKIEGVAPSCQQALEGSGFVVSPERVMTNAHVVAGTTRLRVQTVAGASLAARVVLFDSRTDIAVLYVPGLAAPALRFADTTAATGTDAIVLGYPQAGPFTANAVRVREVINLSGPDIYHHQQVLREVYTVRGQIRQGNSGGPMIGVDGSVLGVVFGAAEDANDDTGFVLTAKAVQADLRAAKRAGRVSTRACLHS